VLWIAVRVQEQDGDPAGAAPDRLGGNRAHLGVIERDQHAPLRIHVLADLEVQVAVDQRFMLLEEQVIRFRR